jgi:hypothetical protein
MHTGIIIKAVKSFSATLENVNGLYGFTTRRINDIVLVICGGICNILGMR